MKCKIKIILSFLFVFVYFFSYGQMQEFNYKRTLETAHDQWHRIILPDEIFGKINTSFSDLRIFGITKNNDSITAPYIFEIASEKIVDTGVAFKIINQTQNAKGFYFTFQLNEAKTINQIKLDFKQEDFDWRINLEGSNNQQEWFTIVKDYRILSIRNELTSYRFTTISFPDAGYRYFRLFLNDNTKPVLLSAKISKQEITEGKYKVYPVTELMNKEEKENKQSVIALSLSMPVPVSWLKVYVHDKIDYYRPVSVRYLADSFKTENGWMYNYIELASGTLNSIEKNEFKFDGKICKKLQLLIDNGDNQPLNIDSLQVKGFEYTLMTRFTEPADYFLVYGNSNAAKPSYDIEKFAEKVPGTTAALSLGNEQIIEKGSITKASPLFQNKLWLWSIMAVIIVVLGWFSVKLMRKAS
jgi:Protein of unknown function (DUF3999)